MPVLSPMVGQELEKTFPRSHDLKNVVLNILELFKISYSEHLNNDRLTLKNGDSTIAEIRSVSSEKLKDFGIKSNVFFALIDIDLLFSKIKESNFSSLEIDVSLHLGSLIAIIVYFWKDLLNIYKSKELLNLIFFVFSASILCSILFPLTSDDLLITSKTE